MENNYIAYKRVKINWLFIIIFVGIHLRIIYLYVHQLGNNPVSETGLIIFNIMWIFIYILIGRYKLIIDDDFVIFRSDLWVPINIPIVKIISVSIKQVNVAQMINIPGKDEKHYFDFVKQAIIIKLESGKTYQIAIKDAKRIKEEIEKRMIKPLFNEK